MGNVYSSIPELNLRLDIIQELRRMARHGASATQLVNTVSQRLGVEKSSVMAVRYFRQAFHLGIKVALDLYSGADDGSSWWADRNAVNEASPLIMPVISTSWNQPWLDEAEQALCNAIHADLVRIAGQEIAQQIVQGSVASQGTRILDDRAEIKYQFRDGQSWTVHLRKTERYWELIQNAQFMPST